MAANPAFLRQKWAKQHAYAVQECIPLGALDIILGEYEGLPDVKVVESRRGVAPRLFVICPRCGRRCEYLFLPPPTDPAIPWTERKGEWACRKCLGLVYASQRYSRRHLLRRISPPRKSQRHRGIVPEWMPRPRRGRWGAVDALLQAGEELERLPWWRRLDADLADETSAWR